MVGRGGRILIGRQLWRATKDNQWIEEITGALETMSVDWNVDRPSTMMAGRFTLHDPSRIDALTDYLAPVLTLQYEDGRPPVTQQMGLYTLDLPTNRHRKAWGQGEFLGRDLTWLLQQKVLTETINFPIGTNFGTAIVTLIELAGITRHHVRTTTRTMGRPRTFHPGTTVWEALTALVSAIGWYLPMADLDGTLVTLPYRKPEIIQPSATYRTGDPIGEVEEIPGEVKPANVVAVIQDDGDDDPIVVVRKNELEGSPTSIERLGYERLYEDRVIQVSEFEDQAAVEAYADRLLAQAATYYRTVRMTVHADATPGIHRTVDLDVQAKHKRIRGRFGLRTWAVGFFPGNAPLQLELSQVTEPYEETVA